MKNIQEELPIRNISGGSGSNKNTVTNSTRSVYHMLRDLKRIRFLVNLNEVK